MLHNFPEERRSHLRRGVSLKSHTGHSGLNGCCTAMRKAIRNTKRLLAFWLDGAPCKNKDEYGYSITLTKRDDTGTWKRKHQIAASGELTVAYEVNTIREFHENLNEKWHWTGWYIHYGLLDEPDSGSHRLPMLHHTTAGIKTTLYENSMHMMCRFDKDLKLLFSFFFIFFFYLMLLYLIKRKRKWKSDGTTYIERAPWTIYV